MVREVLDWGTLVVVGEALAVDLSGVPRSNSLPSLVPTIFKLSEKFRYDNTSLGTFG